jgi:hypothetical protein
MRQRAPLLVSMTALLVLALIVARGHSGIPHGAGLVMSPPPPRSQPTLPPVSLTAPTSTVFTVAATAAFGLGLVVLLLALAAGIALLAGIRLHRRRRTRVDQPTERTDEQGVEATGAPALLRGARSALADLRQRPGGPPADAVQRAWLSLEDAAADQGTRRRPEQTPTEFTGSLLAAHEVDPAALAVLRGRYQRARFGPADAVTRADAEAAIDALARIAVDLAARAETEPEVTR